MEKNELEIFFLLNFEERRRMKICTEKRDLDSINSRRDPRLICDERRERERKRFSFSFFHEVMKSKL